MICVVFNLFQLMSSLCQGNSLKRDVPLIPLCDRVSENTPFVHFNLRRDHTRETMVHRVSSYCLGTKSIQLILQVYNI